MDSLFCKENLREKIDSKMDQDDVEQESGVASNGSANASGGETNGGSGEENSSYFWSSSNSYDDSGPDLSGVLLSSMHLLKM